MIIAAQCRAARAWLDPQMTQAELAKAVGCGLSTIHEFESGRRSPQAYVLAIQHILEERGIIFHPRGIDGPDGK